jgi:hypothetical protein
MSRTGDECLVVFDTGPIRNLAHTAEMPTWVTTCRQMKEDSYRFSLADNACAELINQRVTGSIGNRDFERLISCLEIFLDPIMPVMLGGKDVLTVIGAKPRDEHEPDASDVSRQSWIKLQRSRPEPASHAEIIIEEFRADWKSLFQRLDTLVENYRGVGELNEHDHPLLDAVLASMSRAGSSSPPLSTRLDLSTRYVWRQFVRRRKPHGFYNINAKKKRNDGIDFTLYTYLALPALVVTTDRGLLEGIADIESFQTSWIYRIEDLVDMWLAGDRPQSTWPPAAQ